MEATLSPLIRFARARLQREHDLLVHILVLLPWLLDLAALHSLLTPEVARPWALGLAALAAELWRRLVRGRPREEVMLLLWLLSWAGLLLGLVLTSVLVTAREAGFLTVSAGWVIGLGAGVVVRLQGIFATQNAYRLCVLERAGGPGAAFRER